MTDKFSRAKIITNLYNLKYELWCGISQFSCESNCYASAEKYNTIWRCLIEDPITCLCFY